MSKLRALATSLSSSSYSGEISVGLEGVTFLVVRVIFSLGALISVIIVN